MSIESVKARFTKFFTENIGLKILSLLIAVFLWFIVINITDPVIPKTYKNVPVDIINSEVITNSGRTLEILDDSDIISNVIIKAPRSVIRELGNSTDQLKAIADMRYLSADETSVPISFTVTKYADKIESVNPSKEDISVRIENRKTVMLPISATTSGEIESGYVVGNISQDQNQVRVSGPQSIISQISYASVDVQVTGFKEKISTYADIVLYDKDGEEIESKNVELSVGSVRVDVEILATKRVAISLESSGNPAEGYATTGVIESDVDSIIIAGTPAAIDRLDTVRIPAGQLNVNGLSSSLKTVINVVDYLPVGVRLADTSFSGLINVTVYIEEYQEKTFSVYLRNIEVRNIPDGFKSTKWDDDNDYVEFVLVGLNQNLEKVQISQLNFAVDFTDYELMNDISGFKPGTYELPLLMDLPEGVWIKEAVDVSVILNK